MGEVWFGLVPPTPTQILLGVRAPLEQLHVKVKVKVTVKAKKFQNSKNLIDLDIT